MSDTLINAYMPNLAHIYLAADTGSVTITGIFVDKHGGRVVGSVPITYALGTSTLDSFNTIAGVGGIPDGAVGFRGNISGAIRMDISEAGPALIATLALLPKIATASNLRFGLVNPYL